STRDPRPSTLDPESGGTGMTSSSRCLAFVLLSVGISTAAAQSPAPQATFTRPQADAGGRVYARACASCHGARLDDGIAEPLAGPVFLQKWSAPGRSL